MQRLKNKVAIITGGAGGIGLATAQKFLSEGASVVIADLANDQVASAVKELSSDRARGIATDISKAPQVQAMVDFTVREFGGVDILFDNAGIEGKVAPLHETSEENFDQVLGVNLKGVWLCLKLVVPQMLKRGGGSIMITSSVAGLRGFAGLGPYTTSKHAVIGLMRSAAAELGSSNIRVNTINPGPVENRMMRSLEEQFDPKAPQGVKQGFVGRIPLGRYAENGEVADLALFLASDEARYLTGQTFVIDGGFTI